MSNTSVISLSLLSEEFLNKYKDIRPKNAGVLFDVVYLRTYSRWIPELKRRERWWETIKRVVDYSISLYQGPAKEKDLIKEAELMYDKLFHLEVYPAGRTYWIGGSEASKVWPESNLNCTTMVIDELEDFCDLFHLLMVGAGVGYRILKSDVEKLPIFNSNIKVFHEKYNYIKEVNNNKDKTYNSDYNLKSYSVIDNTREILIDVGDSKEGWVQALRYFLSWSSDPYYFENGISFHFNYDRVRPAGTRIKRFGGRAAGSEGLMDMFSSLAKVINESGGKLSPTSVMDICNLIAKNVLVGGVRRSSQIALGSEDDEEFINAKVGLYTMPHMKNKRHRTMSNNSLVFFEKPTRVKLDEIFERIKTSWEPGFLNFKYFDRIRPWFAATNPCGELAGADKGNCLVEGTEILTKEGFRPIEDCKGSSVLVPFESDDELYRNERFIEADLLDNGLKEAVEISFIGTPSLKLTKNHKVLIQINKKLTKTNIKRSLEWVKVEDLKIGDLIVQPCTNPIIKIDTNNHNVEFLTAGWLIGDGWQLKDKRDKEIFGVCFGPTEALAERVVINQIKNWYSLCPTLSYKKDSHKLPPQGYRQSNGVMNYSFSKTSVLSYLKNKFGFDFHKGPDKVVPGKIKKDELKNIAAFLSGLFSADGCVCALKDKKNGYVISLASSSLQLLKEVSLLLKLFGVHGKFTFNAVKGRKNPQGALCIKNQSSILNFKNLIDFSLCPAKQSKLKDICELINLNPIPRRRCEYAKIRKIENLGFKKVYDLSIPNAHHFLANGLVVHNCNLSGVNLLAFIEDGFFNLEKAKKSIRMVTRIGLRQTNITLTLPEWDKVHKRDRLLGVSLTGIVDLLDRLNLTAEEAKFIWCSLREAANEEADKYSFEMRVPRPLLVTLLKPEGSISKLPTVSAGLHRSEAPYYIRRIRVSSMDPVCKALIKLGVPNEPDSNKAERMVFSFPIKSNTKMAKNDESAISQLNRYLTLMNNYVDHNASATIFVGENEWEDVKDWVYNNWDDIGGISFANKDYSQYPQLPEEAISKEQYEAFPKIDTSSLAELVDLYEQDEFEEVELENECQGGSCPTR